MTEPVSFFVHGVPAPQGSHTAIKRGDRAIIVPGSSTAGRLKHATWRNAVSLVASQQGAYFDEPVSVGLSFYFAPVKSDSYRTRHVSTPDLDKITRSSIDSLVAAGLLRDDSLVFDLHACKFYAPSSHATGAMIEIWGFAEEEERDRATLKEMAKVARKASRA